MTVSSNKQQNKNETFPFHLSSIQRCCTINIWNSLHVLAYQCLLKQVARLDSIHFTFSFESFIGFWLSWFNLSCYLKLDVYFFSLILLFPLRFRTAKIDENDFSSFCSSKVFVRRIDGSESFFRPWKHYKAGFGNVAGEYWLGEFESKHLK